MPLVAGKTLVSSAAVDNTHNVFEQELPATRLVLVTDQSHTHSALCNAVYPHSADEFFVVICYDLLTLVLLGQAHCVCFYDEE